MFRILVLVAALAAGGAAAWLSTGVQPVTTAAAPMAVPAPPQIKTEEVLVAAAELAKGKALSPADLRWQTWPEDAVNASFIRRSARPDAIEQLDGSVVRQAIVPGEPILSERLADKGSSFLAAQLPPGRRAIAVRVSAETAAGGFILPNDRVDVIHTFSRNESGPLSRTILTNIRVLAIDQAVDSGGESVIGKTATLELDPVQAEVIAGAESSGALSLALRATADSDEAPALTRSNAGTVRIVRAGRSQTVTTSGPVQFEVTDGSVE